MARVGGGGGPRWVWPLIIVLILLGLTVLAWAFLAPQAPGTQPTEQATEEPAAAPTTGGEVSVKDIMADPSEYFGEEVTVDGRITRLVGDRGFFLADRDGGNGEMMAIIDRPISETELRNDDFGRFSGTVREVTDEEVDRLSDEVDKPTLDALSKEKAYLQVEDFEEVAR